MIKSILKMETDAKCDEASMPNVQTQLIEGQREAWNKKGYFGIAVNSSVCSYDKQTGLMHSDIVMYHD